MMKTIGSLSISSSIAEFRESRTVISLVVPIILTEPDDARADRDALGSALATRGAAAAALLSETDEDDDAGADKATAARAALAATRPSIFHRESTDFTTTKQTPEKLG